MDKLLEGNKLSGAVGRTYVVRQNITNKKTFRSNGMLPSKYHIFLEKKNPASFRQRLLSVKELGGRIVDVKIFERK